MKKILVLFALAAFFIQANAQETKTVQIQVPAVISTSFSTSYPSVEHPVWKKYGTNYIVYYTASNSDAYVLYDPSGKVIETGEGVAVTAYPAPVTTYVKTKYKDEHIEKVYKVKDVNGKTIWKGKVKNDYLIFDENGNYIKMEKD